MGQSKTVTIWNNVVIIMYEYYIMSILFYYHTLSLHIKNKLIIIIVSFFKYKMNIF